SSTATPSATLTPSMTPQPSTSATATASPTPTITATPTASTIATPSPTGATATPTPIPVFALVAGVSATTTGASTVTTNTWTPGTGNTIGVFVEIASASVSVSNVSDGLGNSYTFASGRTGINGRVGLWYSIGIKGGSSDSITDTLSGSAAAAVRGEEFSGVPVNATLQQSNTNAGAAAGTNATTGNVTTTAAPSYFIADIGWNSGAAASATQGGFARIGQLSNSDSSATICYLFAKASAPGTFGTGVTLSTSSNWQGVLAAFA